MKGVERLPAEEGSVVKVTERYYDGVDADRFYYTVWGGEDIHIGIYRDGEGREAIAAASRRTVEVMIERLTRLDGSSVVADLGAGYGGSARYLARRFGCQVRCLNLSATQNGRNLEMNDEAGLSERVEVHHGNFEEVPFESSSVDVVWSQDAFLHSARKHRVLEEAARILKPGGELIFTDPMQAEDCPSEVLAPVLERIHLDSLGSVSAYRAIAREMELTEMGFVDLSPQLPRHYAAVRDELGSRRKELARTVSPSYIERMLQGLDRWIEAGQAGHLTWGILHFRR